MAERRAEAAVVRPHPAVRTLLLTSGEIRAVVLDQRSGNPHVLDSAAAAVWALLDEPRSLGELERELVSTFGISSDEAAVAVEKSIRSFRQLEMLAQDGDGRWAPDAVEPTSEEARPLPREHDP